jgi:hypothetical protein
MVLHRPVVDFEQHVSFLRPRGARNVVWKGCEALFCVTSELVPRRRYHFFWRQDFLFAFRDFRRAFRLATRFSILSISSLASFLIGAFFADFFLAM